MMRLFSKGFRFVTIALAGALLSLVCLAWSMSIAAKPAEAKAAKQPPNILLFILDDVGIDPAGGPENGGN